MLLSSDTALLLLFNEDEFAPSESETFACHPGRPVKGERSERMDVLKGGVLGDYSQIEMIQ